MAILRDVDQCAPVGGNWRRLDELLEELWASGIREGHLSTLFRVFERFSTDDGAGVLWSIVQGIEGLDWDYQAQLRESIARQPSLMGKVMLERLEKGRAV